MQRCSALLPIRIRRLLGHEVGGDGLDPAEGRVLPTAKNWTDEIIVQHTSPLGPSSRGTRRPQPCAAGPMLDKRADFVQYMMGYEQDAVGNPSPRLLSVPVLPTTSRRPVPVRARSPVLLCRVSRQTAYSCSRPPAHRARVASHPTSSCVRRLKAGSCTHLMMRALTSLRAAASGATIGW